ncbi:MAG: hypothetical protein J0M30_14860 [Chitinophagales bacterium]|nr:hypothetical protein [Chitinophagales bacterium]
MAQALMTAIVVYNYQKEKAIPYGKALSTYINAEVGYYIIGFVGIFSIMFLLSDWIDLSITKDDLRSLETRSWKENLQLYFKTSSFGIGAFVQYLAFKFRTTGKKAIDNAIKD